MKKILAIVLAVVMLLPVFAVNVFAADTAMNLVVSSGRITLKLDDVVKAGESVDIHIKGTTDGAFRSCLSDAASKGSNWNQSDMVIVTVTNGKIVGGAFDFTASIKANADAQYLLISTGAAWQLDGEDPFSKLVIESVECNGKTVSFDTLNTSNGSAKLQAPETEGKTEKVTLVENTELAGWNELFPGDTFASFKSAIVKEGAKIEFNYELTGESGWYSLAFDPMSCDSSIDQSKDKLTVYKDKIVADLGSIDNMTDVIINPWGGTLSATTCTVIDASKNVIASVDLNKDASGWTTNFLGDENNAIIIEALKKDEADALVLNYTMTKDAEWPGGNFHINGKRQEVNLDKSGKMTLTGAEVLALCPAGNIARLKGVFSNCNGDTGSIKYTSIVVTVPAAKKSVDNNLAYVYVTDEYHAVLIGGRFLAMPHTEILGYCPMCHAFIETEAADKSVFVLETTGGQDFDTDLTVADGVKLADNQENNNNCRIATNWKSGGTAWNGIVKAIPTEGAWLKITYTGKLNSIIFQTANNAAPEEFETTTPAVVEEGDQNVAWFNCADIVANSPNGLSGAEGWANFMLNFEGDTTVYGFEILVPAVVPTAE